MRYEVGDTLDRRYSLKRLIARSEVGDVFEARHLLLPRSAAVRLLAPDQAPEGRASLLREAELLERVQHPGVLRVLDAAETVDGVPYLVTEPLTGRPLDGLLAVEGRLLPGQAIALALSLCRALSAAHAVGVFHAGLDPASVLVTESRVGDPRAGELRVKLLGFGAAPNPLGMLVGSLAAMGYAAPERLAGAPPEAAADVYGVGAMLFEMLTSELPERGASSDPSQLADDVPPAVASAVTRALSPPDERYPSVDALAEDLRGAATATPSPPSLAPPERVHPRAGYVTPVRIRRPTGDALDGRTEDISEGGMLVLADGDVEVGESVLVRFALPSSGRLVSAPARTRWARTAAGREALGLQLEAPDARVVEDIRAYVEYMGRPPGPTRAR